MRFIDYKRHFVLIKLYRGAPKYRSDLLGAKKFSDFTDVCLLYRCNVMHSQDWLVGGGWVDILLDGSSLAIYFGGVELLWDASGFENVIYRLQTPLCIDKTL